MVQVISLESVPLVERAHVREGTMRSRRLLVGESGTPGNFSLQLSSTPTYYSPRHRHNFDQVRFQLEGDFDFAADGVMKPGSVAYFPEGTYYGPQSGPTLSTTLVLQFGGAVGTLASLGDRGVDIANALGKELRLAVPNLPWHSHRDRIAEVATTFGLLAGTLGKIARDISLHTQTEVAEIFEPAGEGRGGSSTMPHKRNPVAAAVVLAASVRIPGLVSSALSSIVQEEERGLGGWHAEWEIMPELISLTGGALHHLTGALSGLEVDVAKMHDNLDVTHGLIFAEAVQMALAREIGRLAAHDRVEAAAKRARKEGRNLKAILAADAEVTKHLNAKELDRLFEPRNYLGVANEFIDRVLKAHSSVRLKTPSEGDSH